MFRFRLYTREMDELGEFETMHPTWSHGDEFLTGEGLRYRIVSIVPAPVEDAATYRAVWKVEHVAPRAARP